MRFSKYGSKSRSMFTFVLANGITISILGDGTLLGATAPLRARLREKVVSGAMLVTTPHRLGAFSERGAGGIYPAFPTKAKTWTLRDAILRDPRATDEDKAAAIAAVFGN